MLAILTPGQGALQQGFLSPWLDVPGVVDTLRDMSDVTGIDLVDAGVSLSDSDIADTAIAQPLLVAAGLASTVALHLPADVTVVAGHSVGEITAAAVAGCLTSADAVRLARVRGRAMAEACRARPGTMVAVLGGAADVVDRAVSGAGCTIANYNIGYGHGSGQVVAAGSRDAIDRLLADPPVGARMRPLAVSGAFHTELMASATDVLAETAATLNRDNAGLGWVSNRDGRVISDGAQIIDRIVGQVTRPVRWDECTDTLRRLGVTAVIELVPAGTLTAMVRRALPGITAVALRTPDDLAPAQQVIDEHAAIRSEPAPPWRLVVSPARGRVGHRLAESRSDVTAGDVLVDITTRDQPIPVVASVGGRLVEWLVDDGDPVNDGQPLARLVTTS